MDIDRRIAELTTLNQIAATLNESLDLRSALQSALAQLVQLLGLTTGWIFLLDPHAPGEPAQLIHTADFQLPPGLAADNAHGLKSAGCSCQTLFEKGKLKKSINIVECSRLEDASAQGRDVSGLRYHASAPIRARDRVIGILNVASATLDRFSDEDLQLMTVIGNQIGLAAERARLFDLTRAQRVREQAALLNLSNALLSSHDLQAVVDQVVQLVAEALNADACALVLADADGNIEFRASLGWNLALFEGGPPHFVRNAPAGRAYYNGEQVCIDDLDQDPLSAVPNLIYKMMGFRSALAVPVTAAGQRIGALLVNTHAPRHFDDDEIRLLQLMANQAAIAIEQARLQERALAEQRLRKELELARQIQTSFLPRELPALPGWEFGAHYAAAREVGGDFYDFIALRDPAQRPAGLAGSFLEGSGLLGLVVADVSDKGVPAALFMALCRTLIRAVAISGRSPADAIQRTNELILNDSRTDQFITVFYGVLDPDAATLRFVNAGHNPPMLVQAASGAIFALHAPGTALGILDSIQLTESQVRFEPDDVLLLYTDGVTDALNANVEEFGMERLAQLLVENRQRSASEIVRGICEAIQEFVGQAEPFDDMTIVALKRVG
ncbi:MAG TPA: SpoIIE family protein phosphatase [Anaerolineae bacterium]|nr:SpoIIE family protein phosphatase [Anaerolineae bacterium]